MPNNRKTFLQRLSVIERKYRPKVHRQLRAWYKAFAGQIRSHGLEAAKARLSLELLNTGLLPVLNDLYREAGLKGALMTYYGLKNDSAKLRRHLKSFKKSNNSILSHRKNANIGRNQSWINEVLNYLKINLLQFVSNISNTTKNDILKIVSKGVDEGMSMEDIAREVETSGMPLSRSRVVVRTEAVRGMNVGHSIGAKSFPFEVKKKWSAAHDRRTRSSHRFVNGHTTSENGTFEVPVYQGGKPTGQVDQMQFPGDPKAHASNQINCRCRVVYEPIKDGTGRPIPRRTANLML